MPINSEYIRKKEFHVAFKGYKQDEVDKFLDILAFEMDKLIKKNIEIQEGLDKVKYEGFDDDNKMNKVIQDVLVSAHKIADDVKMKAQAEAEEYIRSRKDTEQEQIRDLLEKKQQLEVRVKYLFDTYEELKSKIKNSIKSFDRFLSEEDITIETDIEEAKDLDFKDDEIILSEEANEDPAIQKEEDTQEELSDKLEEEEEKKVLGDEDDENMDEKIENYKKSNKNQDIANPDIISEFFSSDEN
jgi:DivIVA domain-containing protein